MLFGGICVCFQGGICRLKREDRTPCKMHHFQEAKSRGCLLSNWQHSRAKLDTDAGSSRITDVSEISKVPRSWTNIGLTDGKGQVFSEC